MMNIDKIIFWQIRVNGAHFLLTYSISGTLQSSFVKNKDKDDEANGTTQPWSKFGTGVLDVIIVKQFKSSNKLI